MIPHQYTYSYVVWCFAATKQVVAGVKFDLYITIGATDCRNPYTMAHPETETRPDSECVARQADLKSLHAVVIWKAWEDPPYTVTLHNLKD